MHEREVDQFGEFQIATAQAHFGSTSWWAWAKLGAIQSNSPLLEPGANVCYEFGSTRQEAADKIRRMMAEIQKNA